MIDYEKAMINRTQDLFPGAIVTGCKFHIRKAIWSKIKEPGPEILYHRHQEFIEMVYKVFGLAYVPQKHIVRFYNEFVEDFIQDKIEKVNQINSYPFNYELCHYTSP